jgi:hypothetical protein
MDKSQTTAFPLICQLEAPLLQGLRTPLFRRAADDGEPVLAVRMGEREAVVPLRDLQARLGIPDDSRDGRMLGTIAAALHFVSELRPGDPLPDEVLSGEASWQPAPVHHHIAANRVRGRLIQWLRAAGVPGSGEMTAADFDRAAQDPALAALLNTAFGRIAAQLNLRDALEVLTLMASLATELACIEALREQLLVPLRHMARKIEIVSQGRRGDGRNTEMLVHVSRLCRAGLGRIGARFNEVDQLTDDIVTALGGGPGQQLLIRANRDWLYRTYRVAGPLLAEWEAAPAEIDDDFWNRLARSYRFLAPRFMVTQEWKPAGSAGPTLQKPAPGRAR